VSAILENPHLAGKRDEDEADEIRLVFRVHTMVKRVVNQTMLSALGISLSHGSALLHLARSHEVSCQELAQLLGCGTSRISRLIQELEKRRLVESRRGSTDRRVLQLSLTPNGAALADRVPAVLRDAELRTFCVLAGDDRRCLIKFLSRMVFNMNRFSE
jgi:DNA-binding MarR family transcriptional regulator